VSWFDPTAAACTELVVEIVDALGVPLGVEIATHVYLGILTDTGSFHHSNITARTFEICRRVAAAGVRPADLAQQVYNNASLGRLRLLGSLLERMRLDGDGALAVLYFDDDLLHSLGATHDDTEGLINVPLSSRSVQAVALLKGQNGSRDLRVSLRSKGGIDVRSVAQRFGGGGHFHAAGFSVPGPREEAEAAVVAAVREAMKRAAGSTSADDRRNR
jgi:phosphoesterase RecJ-like protein